MFAQKPLFHRILIERNPHISSSIDTTGDGDAGTQAPGGESMEAEEN